MNVVFASLRCLVFENDRSFEKYSSRVRNNYFVAETKIHHLLKRISTFIYGTVHVSPIKAAIWLIMRFMVFHFLQFDLRQS